MKTENKKRCYVAADLGWRAAVFCVKCAVGFCVAAFIPSLAVDIAEYRERKKARVNKK